jgi:hypothetical protein
MRSGNDSLVFATGEEAAYLGEAGRRRLAGRDREDLVKRAALTITLISVGVFALLAVIALLGGEIGDTEWRIILSALLVTAAAMVALACAVPLHAGRLGMLPYAGIGASTAGFGMVILGMWSETSWDAALKVALSLVGIAVAIGGIGLLDAARVRSHHRWVVTAAQGITAFGAALLIASVWGEIDNPVFWRLTGVVLVLAAAAAVMVPVLHRLADIPREQDAVHDRAVEACPLCGSTIHGPLASRLECPQCGESFRVLR